MNSSKSDLMMIPDMRGKSKKNIQKRCIVKDIKEKC